MTYCPDPIDTHRIELPTDLLDLRERLARHVHDIWAQGRIREGWVYGPGRDDQQKTHPGLVPFEELAESEKAYDRDTAMETLKAIIANGWDIQRRSEQ